jgi:type III secretion system HrpB4-like protein
MDARLDMRIAHDGQAHVARRLAILLRRYERNLRSLIDWIDPSWLAGLVPPGVLELAVDTVEREQLSLAVAERLGVSAPPLSSFSAKANELLGVLEVREVLDLWRIRALLFRRAELRSWIDRPSRERVSQWVGHDATFFVRALQVMPDAPKVERFTRTGNAPELAALTASRLAWEGLNLFACDERTSERGPLWLLRFALPREFETTPWIAHRALFEESAYGPDNERVFLQLKHWFGQRTWSSGFDSLG